MRKGIRDDDGIYWKVIDLETGKEIKDCIRADDETGKYEIYARNNKGEFILVGDKGYENIKTEMRKGKIKLIDTRIEKEGIAQ